MRPLRILVVDDDPAMVGAISALIGTEGHQVFTAYDGLTAVRRFREERPDVVLIDLAMPGQDGYAITSQIRKEADVPIVIVSGESSEEAKVRALGLGADDYLVKPFGRAEFVARLTALMRRTYRSPAVPTERVIVGALVVEPARHEVRIGDTPLILTPIEFRLLEVLAGASGDVVPHLQLVRTAWPAEANPDVSWLKPHIGRLRLKLESAAGGPEIVAVRGVGYQLSGGRRRAATSSAG